MSTPRGQILEQAKNLTEGDRNKAYGEPYGNMFCFLGLVNAYINGKISAQGSDALRVALGAEDGAIIMALAKISRIAVNPSHMDSYIALAAYAAIAGECAGITDAKLKEMEAK